jgi:hypothetical protein
MRGVTRRRFQQSSVVARSAGWLDQNSTLTLGAIIGAASEPWSPSGLASLCERAQVLASTGYRIPQVRSQHE